MSPPAADVLDRVVALSPDDLRADASTVADFVNSFVSADVADSQNVGNWPTHVTAGLDALHSYAAAQ